MQGYDRHHRPSKSSWLKTFLVWITIIILIFAMVILRYGWFSFFTIPQLILHDNGEDFTDISPEGSFVLEFDQRMKRETVEAAVHIEPSVSYHTTWDGNSLLLKPDQKLELGHTYELSLDKKAQSFFGRPLQKNYTISYKVGSDPTIVKIFPDHTSILPGDQIIIIFSHPMVGEKQLGIDIQPDNITLSPHVDGQWQWRNLKMLVFTPNGGFPLSGRYHLENTSPLFTFDETPIRQSIDETFETDRLQLLSKSENVPNLPAKRNLVSEPFLISFNSPVDTHSLELQSSLRDSTGKILQDLKYLQVKDSPNSYTIQRISKNWLYNEKYILSLSADLMPQKGNLSLGQDAELNFVTQPFSSGISEFTSAHDQAHLYIVDHKVTIALQVPMTEQQIQNSLSFVPDEKFQFTFIDPQSFSISLKRDLKLDENVSLYISQAVNTPTQSYIDQPIKFTLSLPPKMTVDTLETPEQICFMSMTALVQNSSLKSDHDQRQLWGLTTDDKASPCPDDKNASFHYALNKKFLQPDIPIALHMNAVDNYDQTISKDILVKPHQLSLQDIDLNLPQSSFYQYFNRPQDLKVSYSTRNVADVKIEICRLTAKDALRVETGYLEGWSNFQVNSKNCIRSKAYSEQFNPDWGQDQSHMINLDQVLDEVIPGLYYVHVFLPTVSDAEGKPIEIGTVLELSNWDLLSKRGESAFLWILDHQNHEPVQQAQIEFYANDGSLIHSGITGSDGLYFQKIVKSDYDYTLVRKDDQEILLSIFHQEGFEPSRFSIPFNAEDNTFRYHYFVENTVHGLDTIRGALIIQRKTQQGLSPFRQSVTLSLSNSQEQVFWKKSLELDRFGVLHFDIKSLFPLLDGDYQISACIGTYEGLCDGTNLWTGLVIKNGSLQILSSDNSKKNVVTEQLQHILSVTLDHEAKVGENITVDVNGVKPSFPLLLTAERDDIYFSQILIPDKTHLTIPLEINASMLPEVMLTLTQFDNQKAHYDMITIPVDLRDKTLETNTDLFSKDKFSTIAFKLNSVPSSTSDELLRFFYPRFGTGIVTGSNQSAIEDSTTSISSVDLPHEQINPDLSLINGELLTSEEIKKFTGVDAKDLKLDAPLYLIMNDDHGHGKSMILNQDLSPTELSMRAEVPKFIRADDRLIIPVWIKNNGVENKNLHIVSSGEGVVFPFGDNILLGVSPGEEKFLNQATQISANGAPKSVSLNMTLMDHDQPQSIFNTQMILAQEHHQYLTKKVMMVQTTQSQGSIDIPLNKSGLFHVRAIVSPSPISFVLDNLHDVLKKDSSQFQEEFFKKVTAVQYFNLLQASLETDQEFSSLLGQQNSIDDELYFMQTRQNLDGGWSEDDMNKESDPWFSANIARSLSVLQELNVNVPESVRIKIINYLKQQVEDINAKLSSVQDARKTPLLQLLNGLSSLTPAGVVVANNLSKESSLLSTDELVCLLLTFEDYRDEGLNGMNYKIEELIQLLKSREQHSTDQLWLSNDNDNINHLSSFTLTSWYLESLVRQASSRTDIPDIITWLVRHKFQPEFQTDNDQFYFLQAMANYLQIFHADILSHDLILKGGDAQTHDFSIDSAKPFQSFVLDHTYLTQEDHENPPTITFQSDQAEPWFIEINWTLIPQETQDVSKGIFIYQKLDSKDSLNVGDTITGSITIVSPEPYSRVIIAQPLVASVIDLTDVSSKEPWYIKSFGNEEKWFIIDHLPAGETVIPFQWHLGFAGVFKTPPIQAWSTEHPEIFGQSNVLTLEIKPSSQ